MKFFSTVTFILGPLLLLSAAHAQSFSNCTPAEIEMMLRNASQDLDALKVGSSLTMNFPINDCQIWGDLVRTQKGIVFVLGTNLAGPRQFTKAFNEISSGVREITKLQRSLPPQTIQDQVDMKEAATVPFPAPVAAPIGSRKGPSQSEANSPVPSADESKGEPASIVSPFGSL